MTTVATALVKAAATLGLVAVTLMVRMSVANRGRRKRSVEEVMVEEACCAGWMAGEVTAGGGRDDSGACCDWIAGGVRKKRLSWTEKASYVIEETILEKKDAGPPAPKPPE